MTQPTTATAPEQAPPPPENQSLVRTIAELLLVGAALAVTAAAIEKALRPLGLARDAVLAAVGIAAALPWLPEDLDRLPGTTPAQDSAWGREVYFRAAYILNASKRIHKARRAGKTLPEAVQAEKRHFDSHRAASENRRKRAAEVDAAVAEHGLLLGWYAQMDARTSAECRAANKHNFDARRKPYIGYPGTVHPHCRCVPGAPFANAPLLSTRKPRRATA